MNDRKFNDKPYFYFQGVNEMKKIKVMIQLNKGFTLIEYVPINGEYSGISEGSLE